MKKKGKLIREYFYFYFLRFIDEPISMKNNTVKGT